ncbi:hypothetical protein SKAU_G00065360 [Synaphobranchus kaupii]|uniref:Uncharacterized protein n=1 Tax=Synaphobranchus kaupii TaxID=118154 RepID=A0A9Q1G654_SYNKA|nr:hypothetical protein SKAU_G00065360 [Synaphobranchus kaupii]
MDHCNSASGRLGDRAIASIVVLTIYLLKWEGLLCSVLSVGSAVLHCGKRPSCDSRAAHRQGVICEGEFSSA